jgi:hypothetical protein
MPPRTGADKNALGRVKLVDMSQRCSHSSYTVAGDVLISIVMLKVCTILACMLLAFDLVLYLLPVGSTPF